MNYCKLKYCKNKNVVNNINRSHIINAEQL